MPRHSRLAHLVNESELVCKLSVYVRNAARFSSSYLLVCFALERYLIVCAPPPPPRLSIAQSAGKSPGGRPEPATSPQSFGNPRNTGLARAKKSICCVFAAAFSLTSYTLYINGLREKEAHELNELDDAIKLNVFPTVVVEPSRSRLLLEHECDTRREFKMIYDYTIWVYVSLAIILPICLGKRLSGYSE